MIITNLIHKLYYKKNILILFNVILLIILIGFSFFFSMSETALFSLTHSKIDILMTKYPKRGAIINSVLKTPQKLLVSILTCNIFANMFATVTASKIFIEVFPYTNTHHGGHLWFVIISMTLIILIFGEATPKSLAIKFAPSIAITVAPVFYFLIRVLFVIIFVFRSISKFIVNIIGFCFYNGIKESANYKPDELIEVINAGAKDGALHKQEPLILKNAVNFNEIEVGRICRPRGDMFMLPHNIALEDVIEKIREAKYSRIPVYRGNEENIIGILYTKDILKLNTVQYPDVSLKKLLRKPIFIPGSIRAEKVLRLFQATHNHIAIVIDEYSGVMGLITMEDIIEQIVGDVVDKNDIKPLYHFYSPDIVEVESKLPINDFNNIFSAKISSENCSTIGGYICEKMQKIPQAGEVYQEDFLRFKVDVAVPNRIESITVTRLKNFKAEKNLEKGTIHK